MYYYNQLNKQQQKAYHAIKTGLRNRKKGKIRMPVSELAAGGSTGLF